MYIRLTKASNGSVMNKMINLFLCLTLLPLLSFSVLGQTESTEEKIPSPSEESFTPASDLVSPFRGSGCVFEHRQEYKPKCYRMSMLEYQQRHVQKIYNEDSSLWYEFSLIDINKNPKNFLAYPKKGFVPFSAMEFAVGSHNVVLRMVAESENWYEVEVNEKTMATKFVAKKNSNWVKTEWEYWLYKDLFEITKDQSTLYDKPNGKPIEGTTNKNFRGLQIYKLKGDWAFVRGRVNVREKTYKGWVKWREGRKLLFGCYLNRYLPSVYIEEWRLPPAFKEAIKYKKPLIYRLP